MSLVDMKDKISLKKIIEDSKKEAVSRNYPGRDERGKEIPLAVIIIEKLEVLEKQIRARIQKLKERNSNAINLGWGPVWVEAIEELMLVLGER